MWFSRQREFRADAGGARLASREKMIAALRRLAAAHSAPLPDQMAAFGIGGGGAQGLRRLFMTIRRWKSVLRCWNALPLTRHARGRTEQQVDRAATAVGHHGYGDPCCRYGRPVVAAGRRVVAGVQPCPLSGRDFCLACYPHMLMCQPNCL